jgi:hypothetical protein
VRPSCRVPEDEHRHRIIPTGAGAVRDPSQAVERQQGSTPSAQAPDTVLERDRCRNCLAHIGRRVRPAPMARGVDPPTAVALAGSLSWRWDHRVRSRPWSQRRRDGPSPFRVRPMHRQQEVSRLRHERRGPRGGMGRDHRTTTSGHASGAGGMRPSAAGRRGSSTVSCDAHRTPLSDPHRRGRPPQQAGGILSQTHRRRLRSNGRGCRTAGRPALWPWRGTTACTGA